MLEGHKSRKEIYEAAPKIEVLYLQQIKVDRTEAPFRCPVKTSRMIRKAGISKKG